MSKFDAILKRIEENVGMAVTPQQQSNAAGVPPKPAAQPTPQQQKQALEQFAQAMGLNAAELQKAIETLKQQQQKQPAGNQQTNQQPAV